MKWRGKGENDGNDKRFGKFAIWKFQYADDLPHLLWQTIPTIDCCSWFPISYMWHNIGGRNIQWLIQTPETPRSHNSTKWRLYLQQWKIWHFILVAKLTSETVFLYKWKLLKIRSNFLRHFVLFSKTFLVHNVRPVLFSFISRSFFVPHYLCSMLFGIN